MKVLGRLMGCISCTSTGLSLASAGGGGAGGVDGCGFGALPNF